MSVQNENNKIFWARAKCYHQNENLELHMLACLSGKGEFSTRRLFWLYFAVLRSYVLGKNIKVFVKKTFIKTHQNSDLNPLTTKTSTQNVSLFWENCSHGFVDAGAIRLDEPYSIDTVDIFIFMSWILKQLQLFSCKPAYFILLSPLVGFNIKRGNKTKPVKNVHVISKWTLRLKTILYVFAVTPFWLSMAGNSHPYWYI